MGNSQISQQIIRELGRLSPRQKKRVLDFTQKLATSEFKGVSGKKLLRFAGSLTGREAIRLRRIIQNGCERNDAAGW